MKPLFYLSPVLAAVLLVTGCQSSNNGEQGASATTPGSLSLSYVSRYSSGIFGASAAEIPAYDVASRRVFVVNSRSGAIDVLQLDDAGRLTYITSLDAQRIAPGALVNSVASQNGLVAVAIESITKTDPGYVAIYNAADLTYRDSVRVGSLPDMLTFTPDGKTLLVANEGEPNETYRIDPEGSVSVIDVSDPDNLQVRTADFRAFNDRRAELLAAGVRIFGPNASVAQDMEPEYITVSGDSKTAWVALQENNALAVVDVANARITDILPLGYKDHGQPGQGLAASDEVDTIDIRTWPGLYGMYHPDAISSYSVNGETYILTANEGDARAWGEDNKAYWDGDASQGFVEELRFKHLFHRSGFTRRVGDDMPPQLMQLGAGALLNPDVFSYCGASAGQPGDCREDELLGRLNVTWTQGYRTHADGTPVMFNTQGVEDPNGDRLMYDRVYSFGARSLGIWSADGQLVWDSGDAIEQYLASDSCRLGAARNIPCADFFNSNHNEGNAFNNRSDNKGPEPEGVVVGSFGGKHYAFLGLERMGGVMVFDVTNPQQPSIVDYLNTREDWATEDVEPILDRVGDLGVEGLVLIAGGDSPTGKPLLISGNEVSGTTAVYQINLQ